jgi:hypothetical protein
MFHSRPTVGRLEGLTLFAVFAVLIFPLHELAHYLTYQFLGVEVRMTLNTATPLDPSVRAGIAELAGPLMNLLIATGAGVAYLRGGRRHRWLAEFALAAVMMRLVLYVLVLTAAAVTGSTMSLGNDEPMAAQTWGLPGLTFIALFAPPFSAIAVAMVWNCSRSWKGRALELSARVVLMLVIGIIIGNLLDPWLFS